MTTEKSTDGPTAHASRDKTKDVNVTVNDVVVAIVYAGSDHPVVVWQVYGPQDLLPALEITRAVTAAIEKVLGKDAPPNQHANDGTVKHRPVSKVMRELLLTGITDEEVWTKAQTELGLPDSAKYRVKEYRRELEKAGQLAPAQETAAASPEPAAA